MILYHKLFSGRLGKWGSERVEFSTKSLKTLNEIFGGIKTIKIFNVEKIFSKNFTILKSKLLSISQDLSSGITYNTVFDL